MTSDCLPLILFDRFQQVVNISGNMLGSISEDLFGNDCIGRNEQNKQRQVIIFYCLMQAQPQQIPAPSPPSRTQNRELTAQQKPSLLVKMLPQKEKKKLIVSDLDLTNPEDKALSLCLKMVEMRKARQLRQNKLIEEIRKSRVQEYNLQVGQVSRVIARDHFISRHEYLRETQYRSNNKHKTMIAKPLVCSQIIEKDKKKNLQRQIEVLQKSKMLTHRYEVRRMVQQILDDAIDYSITMHERKKKFHHKAQTITPDLTLEKEWERRARGKKGSLSLSRVIDLKMMPSDAESDSNSADDEQEEEKIDDDSDKESPQSDDYADESESSGDQQEEQSQESEGERSHRSRPQGEQSMSDNHA